jgi:catecholate siderophore receptor
MSQTLIAPGAGVQARGRVPLRQAAASLASMMLAGAASAQESDSVDLPTIQVDKEGDGYQATGSGLARLPTKLIDTPQTVNVVTQRVMQEQNTATVKDALRNVAGITFRAGEGGNQGDSPYIRGFESRGDIFRDGVRDPGWYTRDAFAIDAVEVYKGPSSFLFGRGSTGGVVNIISKTPQDRTFVEGQVTGTTAPGLRAMLDANGQINDNVAARLVVMGQHYDVAGRDHVEENRLGFAPSLKLKVSDQTKVTLSYIYQKEDSVPDYGIPFLPTAYGLPRVPAPVPRTTWYGILSSPYADVEQVDAHTATAKIEHEFNDQVKVTNTTRYSNVSRFQRNVFPEPNGSVPFPSLNANWTPNRAQIDVENAMLANQTDVNARFVTGSWQHTFVAGLDLNSEKRDFLRNQFAGQGTTNFLNPNPWRAPGAPLPPTAGQLLGATGQIVGAYVADQVKLNQYFELLGGARFDQFKFAQDAPLAAASVRHLEHTDNLLSWRLGAVYHPIPDTSLYVMRGTSFNPSADFLSVAVTTPATALSTLALAPERNETTEVGAKADVLGGRLSLNAAVFRTEKTNMRVPDPANASVTILDGLARVQGIEFGATGKLTDQWQVIASYTYLDSRIVRTTTAAQLGKEIVNTPNNSLSLWTTYDVTPEWTVGGGVYYVGSYWADANNTATVPSYWRVDAVTSYKLTKNASLQFNIYNLFDAAYYAAAYSNWVMPGPSRTAALTLKVRW